MEKQKKKKRLVYTIMRLSVLPISILGIILTVYGQNSVREGMVFEVQTNLSGIAHNLISMYNMLDAGEFSNQDGKILKGEHYEKVFKSNAQSDSDNHLFHYDLQH